MIFVSDSGLSVGRSSSSSRSKAITIIDQHIVAVGAIGAVDAIVAVVVAVVRLRDCILWLGIIARSTARIAGKTTCVARTASA